MIEIHGKKTGYCALCVNKSKKEKEVVTVKGDFNGELCKDHLLAITPKQEKGA